VLGQTVVNLFSSDAGQLNGRRIILS
jgi:hypothetical protein